MREIKFRAWDSYNECLVKVLGLSFDNKIAYVESLNELNEGERYDISFDNLKLMQYTGLKDKNGVEIYEGDIVEKEWRSINGLDRPFYMEVFRDDTGAWRVKYPIKTLDNVSSIKNQIEIVGNIYENPELLEEK